MKKAQALLALAMVVAAATLPACSHAMMMIHGTGARRPAASEFGLGPRTSAVGRYVATLEPARPLRTRQMETVRLIVRDAEGGAIDEAQISIDGGMPQHGHGMNRVPRVAPDGEGGFGADGLLFHMPGSWQLYFDVTRGPLTERAQVEVVLE